MSNHTRPDNIFASSVLADTVIRCAAVLEEHPVRSDHFPIIMWINMKPTLQTET